MNLSLRFYRVLLKLFPARFREEYGTLLEQQFDREYRELRRPLDHLWLWLRALHDLAVSIPREFSNELAQDLRYIARISVRRPFLTLLMLLPLSLGIGATAGVFSVVNALLIRSLPFHDPDRLVQLWMFPRNISQSPSSFYDWAHHSAYLQDAAGYDSLEMNVSRASAALRVRVTETSANFFHLLGTGSAIGRTFLQKEDTPGKNAIAVISYGLWQELFGGDPRVLGTTIHVNGAPLEIVGVSSAGFDYPEHTAVWTPTAFEFGRIPKTQIVFGNTLGRLKPGLSRRQAEGIYEADVRRIAPGYLNRDEMNRPRLISLTQQLAGSAGKSSLVLLGMVAFVLLIGCANVGNILLSRTTGRRKELAIRAALGASKARLVQQLISESILLSLVAGAGGLAVAQCASSLFSKLQPSPSDFQQYSVLDWRVLVFAMALAILTGLLFGVLPALLVARQDHSNELVHRESLLCGSPANRVRSMLLILQVALTLMLVSGAIAMGHGFLKLIGTDLGFDRHDVVTMSVSLVGTRFDSDPNYNSNLQQYYGDALNRLRAVPGVESAALVDYLPLLSNLFEGADYRSASGRKVFLALVSVVTPGYFKTMGARIRYGRDFLPGDREPSSQSVIVNRNFARLLGGVSDLVGKQIIQDSTKKAYTVIGIVETMRNDPKLPTNAEIYYDAERSPRNFMTFVAKVHGRPEAYLSICRDAVQQVDHEIPVFGAKTLDRRFQDAIAQPRLYMIIVFFLGAFALLLALTGVYGVAAYSISQRTHEIGVRIAVGASIPQVRVLVLQQTLLPVFLGMLVGAGGFAAVGKVIQHFIASASSSGAAISISALVLLAITAASAVWIATQRILRLNPIDALRLE